MRRLMLMWIVACGVDPMTVAAEVGDNCDDCHATAPVSAEHPKLVSTSITGCLVCHSAKTGDSLLESVHVKHVEPRFGCADCHGEPVPERTELDALLQDGDD